MGYPSQPPDPAEANRQRLAAEAATVCDAVLEAVQQQLATFEPGTPQRELYSLLHGANVVRLGLIHAELIGRYNPASAAWDVYEQSGLGVQPTEGQFEARALRDRYLWQMRAIENIMRFLRRLYGEVSHPEEYDRDTVLIMIGADLKGTLAELGVPVVSTRIFRGLSGRLRQWFPPASETPPPAE